MKILFCNTGWMKKFDGLKDGDKPEGSAAYLRNNIGHEVYNFSCIPEKGGNRLYGYVRCAGNMNISKIGKTEIKDEVVSISGVTVVWTAPHIEGKGRVIVGWYKNATVYQTGRKEKREVPGHAGQKRYYRVTALSDDATLLLPIEKRNFSIPRGKGYMGQSNIWYADSPEGKELIAEVKNYMKGK